MCKEYYIKIKGQKISVTEDEYYAFKRPDWQESKRRQVRIEKELSLELLMENGVELPSNDAPIDEVVADKLMLDMLHKALTKLSADERILIEELFFNEKSEREIADHSNISHQAVHKKKNRILAKLKLILTEY